MTTDMRDRPEVSPWMPQLARIRRMRDEGPAGVRTYWLQFDDPAVAGAFRFLPGQFNMLYLPGIGEAAISISSDSDEPLILQHTVRAVGNVTSALARLREGDTLGLRGPYGTAWPTRELHGCDVVIACGGIGLAPLRPLIYYLIRNRGRFGTIHLLYGARQPGELLYVAEYEQWQDALIDVSVTVDIGTPEWKGSIGVVTTLLHGLSVDPKRTRILTCGPEIMMRFVVSEALEKGVDPEHVFVSMERNMNCAVGLCGHCQLGPEFICKDGPVFSYARIAPYMYLEDL